MIIKKCFCKKRKVHSAFETLIRDCQSRYLLISYNNEGIISTDELSKLCKKSMLSAIHFSL